MEVRTSSNTAIMSTIFIWLGLANIIGAMLLGSLFDRVNGILLLAICFLFMALFGAVAPTWKTLIVFQALVSLATAFYSGISSGQICVGYTTIYRVELSFIRYDTRV